MLYITKSQEIMNERKKHKSIDELIEIIEKEKDINMALSKTQSQEVNNLIKQVDALATIIRRQSVEINSLKIKLNRPWWKKALGK